MATRAKINGDAQASVSDVATQALQAWKGQFDTALQLVEAMTEGAVKMREWQLQAAVDAHANASAAQGDAARAGDPSKLFDTEAQWMQRNIEQAASYWRILFETGLETNANLLKCLLDKAPVPGVAGPGVDLDASKGALLEMVESAYSQWLEESRRFYAAPPSRE